MVRYHSRRTAALLAASALTVATQSSSSSSSDAPDTAPTLPPSADETLITFWNPMFDVDVDLTFGASIIDVVDSATTLQICDASQGVDCDYAPITYVIGPSTASIFASLAGTMTIDIACQLTPEADEASCHFSEMDINEDNDSSSPVSVTSDVETVSMISSYFVTATVFEGAEKLTDAPSVASTSSSSSGPTPSSSVGVVRPSTTSSPSDNASDSNSDSSSSNTAGGGGDQGGAAATARAAQGVVLVGLAAIVGGLFLL